MMILRNEGNKETWQRDIESEKEWCKWNWIMEEMVFHHRHTFDRVCMTNSFVNAGSVKRYDSARGISLHDPNYFRIILSPIYCAIGTAERVSPIPTFLRNLSLSLCLILESVGKKHLSVCFVCLKSSEGLIVYSSHYLSYSFIPICHIRCKN